MNAETVRYVASIDREVACTCGRVELDAALAAAKGGE